MYTGNPNNARTGRPWTEEDEDRLQFLWSKDVHHAEIARVLDRSPEAVQARAFYAGCRRTNYHSQHEPWTDEEVAILERMYVQEGAPVRDIMRKLDRTRLSVKGKVELCGFHRGPKYYRYSMMKLPAKKWTPVEESNLRTWYLAGVTIQDIAARMGRTEDSVTKKRKIMQLKRGRLRPRGMYQKAAA
jgi:hypothetical protein